MLCQSCGADVPSSARVCPACHMPVSMADVPPLPVGRGVEPPPLPEAPAFAFHPKHDVGPAWTPGHRRRAAVCRPGPGAPCMEGEYRRSHRHRRAPAMLGALIGGLAAVAVKAVFAWRGSLPGPCCWRFVRWAAWAEPDSHHPPPPWHETCCRPRKGSIREPVNRRR